MRCTDFYASAIKNLKGLNTNNIIEDIFAGDIYDPLMAVYELTKNVASSITIKDVDRREDCTIVTLSKNKNLMTSFPRAGKSIITSLSVTYNLSYDVIGNKFIIKIY